MVLLFPVLAVAAIAGIIKFFDHTGLSSGQVANRNGTAIMTAVAAAVVLPLLGMLCGWR